MEREGADKDWRRFHQLPLRPEMAEEGMSELRKLHRSVALFRFKRDPVVNIQWPDFSEKGEIVMILDNDPPKTNGLCRVLTKRGIRFVYPLDLRKSSDQV